MQEVQTEFGPVLIEDFETLVRAERVSFPAPTEPSSAVNRLCALANVTEPDKIGTNGPVTASHVEGADVAPELRRIQAVFGRDALIVSRLVADAFPLLREATVTYFAAAQGVDRDGVKDPEHYEARVEAPGKIPHELRDESDDFAIALTDERGWQWPYFGSDDATALFVLEGMAAVDHRPAFAEEKVVQRDGETRTVAECLDRAVQWVARELGDHELLWSSAQSHGALPLWKDSGPNVPYFMADGAWARASVASVEVQASAYDALITGASSGMCANADELRHKASRLKDSVMEFFWVPDSEVGPYFASAVDRGDSLEPRALDSLTSNMGHLLSSGLLSGAEMQSRRDATVVALLHERLLSPWGVRTLSTHNPHFRPGSYHAGSVWPWENWLFSRALELHGYNDQARDLAARTRAVFELTKRFPEFVWGDDGDQPVIGDVTVTVSAEIAGVQRTYESVPVPQPFQAWSVAAAVCMGDL